MLSKIRKKISALAFIASYKNRKHALYLSSIDKRLDVSAAQIAHLFSLRKGLSLQGKTCLEIGGGWIFSHALVMYLLGAKRIIISDIAPLATPEFLKQAVSNSSISMIRDILSPYEDHEAIRMRLNDLRRINIFDPDGLKKLNIEYRCPMYPEKDIFREKFDFIFSNVVLEYFTEAALAKVLENFKKCISSSGEMLHTVHLEDHDSADPFDYLKTDPVFYVKNKIITHSNRIRFSSYDEIFRNSGWDHEYLYKWERKDATLPPTIDRDLKYNDENDLRTSHFCVYMKPKSV